MSSETIRQIIQNIIAAKTEPTPQQSLEAELVYAAAKEAVSAGDLEKLTDMLKNKVIMVKHVIKLVCLNPQEKVLQWLAGQAIRMTPSLIFRAMTIGDPLILRYLVAPAGNHLTGIAFALVVISRDKSQIQQFIDVVPPTYCYDLKKTSQLIMAGTTADDDPEMILRFDGTWSWPVDIDRHAAYVNPAHLKYVAVKLDKIISNAER